MLLIFRVILYYVLKKPVRYNSIFQRLCLAYLFSSNLLVLMLFYLNIYQILFFGFEIYSYCSQPVKSWMWLGWPFLRSDSNSFKFGDVCWQILWSLVSPKNLKKLEEEEDELCKLARWKKKTFWRFHLIIVQILKWNFFEMFNLLQFNYNLL